MTTEYETAYRRLNDDISDRDLRRLFTPSKKDLDVIHGIAKKPYLPFLVEPYEGMRTLLLNCLDIADLHCLDEASESRALLAVLQRLRKLRRKRVISREEAGLDHTTLRWLREPWPRHVEIDTPEGPGLDRVFLELAIHFRLRNELKSGELFVPKGNRFDDYREHLLDDERFSKELVAENMRHEQQKLVKWAHLAANLIILHNVNEMTRVLRELEAEGYELTEEAMAGTSPFRMGHLNRLGVMLVDSNRQSDPSNAGWQPKSAEASPETPTVH